mmetsp:Transcript_682/g.1578  ORF Transcript_682/g.1578 Transcript_682/m.1578 type:complete len:271 (-) Transcript_682:742-1554(-)
MAPPGRTPGPGHVRVPLPELPAGAMGKATGPGGNFVAERGYPPREFQGPGPRLGAGAGLSPGLGFQRLHAQGRSRAKKTVRCRQEGNPRCCCDDGNDRFRVERKCGNECIGSNECVDIRCSINKCIRFLRASWNGSNNGRCSGRRRGRSTSETCQIHYQGDATTTAPTDTGAAGAVGTAAVLAATAAVVPAAAVPATTTGVTTTATKAAGVSAACEANTNAKGATISAATATTITTTSNNKLSAATATATTADGFDANRPNNCDNAYRCF